METIVTWTLGAVLVISNRKIESMEASIIKSKSYFQMITTIAFAKIYKQLFQNWLFQNHSEASLKKAIVSNSILSCIIITTFLSEVWDFPYVGKTRTPHLTAGIPPPSHASVLWLMRQGCKNKGNSIKRKYQWLGRSMEVKAFNQTYDAINF